MSSSDLDIIRTNATVIVVDYGHRNVTLLSGWMKSPNLRGTLDIIWSCAFTIFLSSWSILCLNTPARQDKYRKHLLRKALWTVLVIVGPEAVLQLALAEYFEARKWTKIFHEAGYQDWTLTHSFYANMGGFHLHSADEEPFPIDVAQLKYLIDKGHVKMPEFSAKEIGDRDKADLLVRVLTMGQILWFLAQCIARLQQGLAISTIEVTTLAFVSSAAFIFFFWLKKPMDVETNSTICSKHTIREIQIEGGIPQDYAWVRSPLEWIQPYNQWAWNLYWHYGPTMGRRIFMGERGTTVPIGNLIQRMYDDLWPVPETTTAPWSFIAHFGYAAILMAGWNLHLPTYTELILFRIACSFQLGLLLFLWISLPFVISPQLIAIVKKIRVMLPKRIWLKDRQQPTTGQSRRWYSSNRNGVQANSRRQRIRKLINDHSDWTISLRLLVAYEIVWVIYGITRMYIIAEDLASLRAMPDTAFLTPEWSQYWPHI